MNSAGTSRVPGGPLISVGVPAYNRPGGLERILTNITRQSYRNLEIIVSDNCSPGNRLKKTVERFREKDSRIKYFRQNKNIGACNNFKFVLEKASGDYFLWAADDDEWAGGDFLANMAEAIEGFDLVFPAVRLDKMRNPDIMENFFSGCRSRDDYLFAWVEYGGYQAIYGIFRRVFLLEIFDRYMQFDLKYFNEGLILHEVFCRGTVKYENSSCLIYSTFSKKPCTYHLTRDLVKYYERVYLYYINNKHLDPEKKLKVLGIITSQYFESILKYNKRAFEETKLIFRFKKMFYNTVPGFIKKAVKTRLS